MAIRTSIDELEKHSMLPWHNPNFRPGLHLVKIIQQKLLELGSPQPFSLTFRRLFCPLTLSFCYRFMCPLPASCFANSSTFKRRLLLSCAAVLFTCARAVDLPPESDLADRLVPDHPDLTKILSPDWTEPSDAPAHYFPGTPGLKAFTTASASAQQQPGVLSGKVVFMNSGHGWIFDPTYWRLQRGVGNSMNEDYGNLDQLNFFADYCFNAGATVVSMRPLGHQTNEVILDNTDAAVTWAGTWSDSTSTIYWGAAGNIPYRFASLAATESATATYTPTLPQAGFYPVYCWVRHGTDRDDQLYRIRHTGGETQVRIPHYRVGNGWVYLGEYYFNAGSNSGNGAVVISNLRGSATGGVVIADGIRFGNGMGSVNQGGGTSGYPREDESMRYWIKANLGQGQSTALYDGAGNDESDSWSAPPKMSAEMNREDSGDIYDRIHISFHSNAGGGRGTLALITSDPTPNQAELAEIAGAEVNEDLVALGSPPLEAPWYNRTTHTYTGGYSEITGSLFNYEMPATIIEVAFHDDASDAALMRDPKARAAVGKAAMHAIVKFMNQFDTNHPPGLNFLPEPPTNPRAVAVNNGQIALAWNAPLALGGSLNPTNYIIYQSTNGFGFGRPLHVGNVTTFTISNPPAGSELYFRITASNAGGESMPSEVVGCRLPVTNGAPRALVVNAYDRLDRATNLRQNVAAQSWAPPGNSGAIERVFPRWNNAFDYLVAHGKALSACGMAFDACQNEACINNQIALGNYPIVLWACGNESTNGEALNALEQSRLTAYLAANGALFVFGADLGFDLDRPTGPSAADRDFLHNQLHASFAADDSGSHSTVPASGGLLAGRSGATFDDGTGGIYWVQSPDVLQPYGPGAMLAATYSTGGGAAVQYDGSAGGGRTVVFGFPFETITSATRRNEYLANILNFLSAPPATNLPAVVLSPPQSQLPVMGSTLTLNVMASGSLPLSYQWRFNGAALPDATTAALTRPNVQSVASGFYDVVVSNSFGMTTSALALVEVILPPLETLFVDNFDANTAGNWIVNRSSTDSRATFNYNYAPLGIPSSPNAIGKTTRGLKMEANVSLGVPAAINASPLGKSFSGDYQLHFDLWLNQNGPFPAGGVGSSQHATAGIGTAGNRVQWTGTGSTADGYWFAAVGEGQASDTSTTSLNDYGAFSATTYFPAASGVYAAGTSSDARGNNNAYYLSAFPGGQTAPSAQQSAFPQQTGGLAVGTIGFAWRDVIIKKAGNSVEWSIDGLRMATLSGASSTAGNFFIGLWDYFASLSDNTNLSFVIYDNVRVERFVTNVPPYLTTQPAGQSRPTGAEATFTVAGGGTPPLSYQWRLAGTNLPGATTSSYTRANLNAADAGWYSVAITNASGSVTSAGALLQITPSTPPKFDLISAPSMGKIQFVLRGDPGFALEFQDSTNLTDWSPPTTLLNPTGTIVFTNDYSADGTPRFYRARYP